MEYLKSLLWLPPEWNSVCHKRSGHEVRSVNHRWVPLHSTAIICGSRCDGTPSSVPLSCLD